MLAECKSSPNGPFTSVEELYSLCNECTLPQAALHTVLNLDIRFRTLTVITIKGVCTLIQQENTTVGDRVRSLKSLISSQLGLSASAEIDDLEASMRQCLSMNSENQHQPSLYEHQQLKIYNFIEIGFLEWLCCGDGFHNSVAEVLLVTEESAETTFMSPVIVNRSNVHLVWPNKRNIQILNGDLILVFHGYFRNTPQRS